MPRAAKSPKLRKSSEASGSGFSGESAAVAGPQRSRIPGVRVLHAFGMIVAIGAAAAVVTVALRHPAGLPTPQWTAANVALLACATFLAALTIVLGGLAWHLLLRTSGAPARWPVSVLTFSLAQYAKYIPGNVAQHFGRVALAKSAGLSVPLVISTIVTETALAIIAATSLAAVSLVLGGDSLFASALAVVSPRKVVMALAVALGVLLLVYAVLSWRGGQSGLMKFISQGTVRRPQLSVLLGCLALYAANLALMGTSMLMLAGVLFGARDVQWLLAIGVFSVAWTAGFLAPGAPAGLGVREAVLVATLGQVFEGHSIAWLALSLRLATTAADTAVFLAAVAARRWVQRAFPIGRS